jgi:hypothetical protein
VRLHDVKNPLLGLVKDADQHCMEKFGLREVAHDIGNMLKRIESLVDMTRQEFGIGFFGSGIAERSIDPDPTGGVACQRGHNLQVRSLDTRTKTRHAARDNVGHYTQGNMQAMLLKPGCNACNCHLHIKRCNTHSGLWDCV